MNRTERTPVRRLLGEIGVPLLLLCALDLAFGVYVAHSDVPLPQLFGGDPITAGKFLALRERAPRPPTLDVLLLGMSQMMRVNGQELEAELSARAQRPVRVFNFAGPYHSFAYDRRLVRDLVVPLAKPAVIVYGLTPVALLNEIVTVEQIDARADELPIYGLYTGSPLERLRGFAMMHLNLWKYREVIHDALQFPLGWKRPPFSVQARAANPAGDIPLLTEHTAVVGLRAWEREHQRRFADFDAVLRTSLLFDYLAQFAQFCRQQGIELVLLSNPVHPLFLDVFPHGRQDYERYLARLRQVAAQAHVRLFEPIPNGVGSPDLYQDTVHHDPAGGAWLTQEVARYLIDNRLVTAQ